MAVGSTGLSCVGPGSRVRIGIIAKTGKADVRISAVKVETSTVVTGGTGVSFGDVMDQVVIG